MRWRPDSDLVARAEDIRLSGAAIEALLELGREPVRRQAIVVASRIAAGDASALRGACRLQSDRDLYRQRIGREHRLLFRLHDEELDVVELAHRRELERVLGRD